MATVIIILPLVLLLLLPLVAGTLIQWRWSRSRGPARSRWSRLRRAGASFALGAVVAAVLLSPLLLTGGWCRATPRGDAQTADSIVAFAFGMGRSDAGRSNRGLAEWLVDNNPGRKPVVAQDGVYLALNELATSRPGCLDGWTIVRLPEHDGVYVDTTGAAFQTDAVLDRQKLSKPMLVAHDLQLQRMVWAFEAIGIRDVVVPDLAPTPFDPESVQHAGTRCEPIWLAREAFAARPLTLRPQTTVVVVALIALLYGVGGYWVWRQ